MEMSALHHMNNFQSRELTAQRRVVNNLMHHMEQYVGNSSANSIEQTLKLKQYEADNAKPITREQN
eukprot:6367124-Prorocentrum_lima.AAC.1